MNNSKAENQENQLQLMVKFFTKNENYSIADNPYSLPASSTPDELNLLIKSILKEDLKDSEVDFDALEFDFYVNGNYLHKSLNDLIASLEDIQVESVIEIEYTERNPPPESLDTITIDDWVSSIRAFNSMVLLGSYDNSVQLWNTKGACLANVKGHTGPVKAVQWISKGKAESDKKAGLNFLSASHDQSIIKWTLDPANYQTIKMEKFVGHTQSVECIDVSSDSSKLISGSWDKMLKLWDLSEETSGETTSKKKKSDANVPVKTPIITLSGHGESISSCRWMDEKKVCTGSWDHSLKVWDVYVGQETTTLKSPNNKIFLSLDYSPLNKLIVAGLNDSVIRIYDPASNEGNLVKISLHSHTGWCSSVFWSTTNEHQLVSGSYDMNGKLWDIRNTKSNMYDLIGHEDKVLCVDWSMPDLILTGSADNTFKMYKT